MDILAVVEATTATTLLNGWANEHAFLDWTVNGQLLRSMLGWEQPPSDTTCMVTGWDLAAGLAWLESLRSAGAGEFPDDRAAVLRHLSDNDGNTFTLNVTLLDSGAVEFAAQDLGPVTASVSDDGEYEYWRSIAPQHVPDLVRLLGGEPGEHVIELLARNWSGARSFDLEALLRKATIPIQLFVY